MRILLVLSVVGQLLRLFSLAFAAPILMAFYDGQVDSAVRFGIAAALAFGAGTVFSRAFDKKQKFYRAEAMAVVAFTWVAVSVYGAVPYLLYGLSWIDALFESMSGLTTTGATILSDFSRYDRAFFLWRSMTQWFGGLGVIALFVVVLPKLGIAGRQLFFAEASGAPSEAVSPQVRKSAERLWVLYSALTLATALLLHFVAGFGWFDSLCHALTTLAAGGFSPNPESVAGYHSPSAEWILSVFMLLAGASFTLQYKVFTGRLMGFFEDGEFLLYAGVSVAAALGVAVVLSGGVPDLDSIRTGLFQSTSLISSTGFASTDFNLWPDAARAQLIIVMLVGGCAGSAAGGPKGIRLLLVVKHILRELSHTLHPRAVSVIRYKGMPVSRDIMRAVFTLVTLYMLGYFLIGSLLVLMGSDLVSGYTAALACLGNIGPGFGPAGPMGNFAGFSTPAKLVLYCAMWVGRLEIVTVLALLHIDVLRNLSLRATKSV